MDRLALYLTLLSAAAVAGALIAVCASLGYTSFWVIVVCIILAFSIAYPSATLVARSVRHWQNGHKDQPRSTRTDPTE
ncbi:hypothetical protein [Roseovarius arcticus]|uniref:hypothetical protein n=1 Tax=Roseovarius arcticus TaxID=2547404 RepID=UPI001110C462|nr:hypothetical protein [Roseovarius arcticus]